jgi:hypothetical protein
MIPQKSHYIWRKLVTGEIHANFPAVSGNMLLGRLSRSIKNDSSESNIVKCIDEAFDFFQKFSNLFENDINKLY